METLRIGERRLSRRNTLRLLGAGAFGLAAGPAVAGAQERPPFPSGPRTHWGRPERMGDGVMATFAAIGSGGRPKRVGVWFTADALSGLAGDDGETGDHEEHQADAGNAFPVHAVDLPMPATLRETDAPIVFAGIDWNPRGHPPFEVYTLPHFDFHFYFVDRATVDADVPPGGCDADGDGQPDAVVPCDVNEKGLKPLAPDQSPPGYVSTEDVVPRMGNHWVLADAPELRGERFTHTLIWGSFDGELTFVEPMITREFLRGLRAGREHMVVTEIAMPEAFPEAGLYPTEYVIRRVRDPDSYVVYLRSFERFPAAESATETNGSSSLSLAGEPS